MVNLPGRGLDSPISHYRHRTPPSLQAMPVACSRVDVQWGGDMASHWQRDGSVFRSVLTPVLRCTQYFSLPYWLNRLASSALNLATVKAPPWISEVYLLATLLVGVLALFAPAFWALPTCVGVATVAIPLYFALDTALFAVRWIFTDDDPLISYKRALAGYLLNIAGVAIFFAAIFRGADCIDATANGRLLSPLDLSRTALYSSVRTVITIGPTRTKELPESWSCGLLLMTENAIAYLLTVIVIAALAGVVANRRKAM